MSLPKPHSGNRDIREGSDTPRHCPGRRLDVNSFRALPHGPGRLKLAGWAEDLLTFALCLPMTKAGPSSSSPAPYAPIFGEDDRVGCTTHRRYDLGSRRVRSSREEWHRSGIQHVLKGARGLGWSEAELPAFILAPGVKGSRAGHRHCMCIAAGHVDQLLSRTPQLNLNFARTQQEPHGASTSAAVEVALILFHRHGAKPKTAAAPITPGEESPTTGESHAVTTAALGGRHVVGFFIGEAKVNFSRVWKWLSLASATGRSQPPRVHAAGGS